MSIRKQISYLNGKFYGRVDLGTNAGEDSEDFDNAQEATNTALVFLAVCVNGHWKVPLGYFSIHSLCGSKRANLLTKCFELLQETGVICHSITFDGSPSNLSMFTSLGSNFDNFSPKFKPGFSIYTFLANMNGHYQYFDKNVNGKKKVLGGDPSP